jgi:nucleotide-binding universal stress UspA family protein
MSIICGTDLSPASDGALDVACALAQLRGVDEVILVHVANADTPDTARAQLDAQVARTKSSAVRVRAELVPGTIEDSLPSFADTEGADLIVIARSSHGKGKIGATANAIISHSHVPVICVEDPAIWLAFAKKERPLRLLVGIDDSATSELGVQWTHAMRAKGPIDVTVGAIYYPDDAATLYGVDVDNVVDRVPEVEAMMSRDLLRRFGGDLASDDRPVNARPRRGLGRIGDHLLELAAEEKIDAIIVGTGQKTGLGRLGSVSSVIVSEARASVICVPPQAHVPTITVPSIQTTLVATDLSSFANRAVAYAFGITPAGGTVHIVHVVKEDTDLDKVDLTRQLVALTPVAAKQKVVTHVVIGDDAADALAQTAARHGADAICISSRGRSGITRALVGSVADRLLRATRLPVLVLRPT